MKLYKNPNFDDKNKKYKLYEDLYTGEQSVMVTQEYLPYHQLETGNNDGAQKARATRETLSKYTNFASRIIRRYKSITFQKDPVLDPETINLLTELGLLDNIDGYGTPFIDYIKDNIFINRGKYGDVFLLTTSDGERIIWDCVIPRGVPDYQFNKGMLVLFRYEYEVQKIRQSSQEQPEMELYSDEYALVDGGVTLTRYKAEKRDSAYSVPDWKVIEVMQVTNFEEIPVATMMADSLLKDCANDILTYHGLKSSLLNQIYHQAYQKIFVTGNVKQEQVVAMSEYTVALIPSEPGEQAANVTVIEPSNPTALIGEKNTTEINIYKSAFHLDRVVPTDSGNIEAADSQAKSKEDLLKSIEGDINSLERLINKALQHIATQAGKSNFNGKVTFNKDVDITSLQDQLADEMAYREDIRKYADWEKALMKKVVTRQGFDTDTETKIIKQIETQTAIALPAVQAPAITLNNA